MTRRVGVWIDRRRAVIVFVDGKKTETTLISLHEEPHHRQSGVSLPADDVRQRQLTGHLNNYYDEVVSFVSDAESFLILGPDEAKGELRKRLEKNSLGRRTVDMETSDKITDPQIVALVRGHFVNQRATRISKSSGLDTPTQESLGSIV